MLLEPLYEQDFDDFSYGFRPGCRGRRPRRRPPVWAKADSVSGSERSDSRDRFGPYGFFDTLDHKQLRELTLGTPQGGVISPLLANLYLHEALDRWWVEQVVEPWESPQQADPRDTN